MKLKKIKKPLLEFIPVFLGVILALFFNNLNESRIDRKKINGLLSKIEMGNEKNIENLELQMAQIQKVVDSLKYHLDNVEMSNGTIVENAGGIRYIQFDLAAWNVLKSSELLVEVDYDLVSLLYLLNESITADSETIIQPIRATDRETKQEFIGKLEDFLLSIDHRIVLSNEIGKLLRERK